MPTFDNMEVVEIEDTDPAVNAEPNESNKPNE